MGVNVTSVRRSGDTMRGNLKVNTPGAGARLEALNGADADRGLIAGTEAGRVIVGTNSSAYELDFVIDAKAKSRIDTNFQRHSVVPNGSTLYPAFDARAWVNFRGTGTVSIRASGNVSSITDLGTGAYRVNLSTAMPDTNFAPVVTFGEDSGASGNGLFASKIEPAGLSTTSQQIKCGRTDTGALADASYVSVAIFR